MTKTPGTIEWSPRHGAWKVHEPKQTFTLHASKEAAETYIATRCTSDDPTNHQGDTCPIHEAI